jgi:acyl-CoA dehydrogenase
MTAIDHADVDGACRKIAAALGDAGLLDACVAAPEGDASTIDSRKACLARETLAWHDGLADFAFAMQGLGSGAIGLEGSPAIRRAVLLEVRAGQ